MTKKEIFSAALSVWGPNKNTMHKYYSDHYVYAVISYLCNCIA